MFSDCGPGCSSVHTSGDTWNDGGNLKVSRTCFMDLGTDEIPANDLHVALVFDSTIISVTVTSHYIVISV